MVLAAYKLEKLSDMCKVFGGFPGRASVRHRPTDGLDLNGRKGGEHQYGEQVDQEIGPI